MLVSNIYQLILHV